MEHSEWTSYGMADGVIQDRMYLRVRTEQRLGRSTLLFSQSHAPLPSTTGLCESIAIHDTGPRRWGFIFRDALAEAYRCLLSD